MKMRLALLFCLGVLSRTLFAQIEPTVPAFKSLHQSTYFNPAFTTEHKFSMGFPGLAGINLDMSLNGINAKNVTQSIDTAGFLNLNQLQNKMGSEGIGIGLNTQIELLHFRFKIKDYTFALHAASRVTSQINIAKDFLGFAINGNAFFAGRTADFSSTAINAIAFNEYGLGVNKRFGKLTLGARFKLLQGMYVASTEQQSLSFVVPGNSIGEIAVRLRGKIRTSGISLLTDSINGEIASDEDKTMTEDAYASFANVGYAFDFGGTYQLNKKLTVGAAILDLGGINWNNQTYTYTLKDVVVGYGGFNYEQLNDGEAMSNYQDSLAQLFKANVSDESFRTTLPLRYNATLNYALNDNNQLLLIYQGFNYAKTNVNAVTFGFTKKFFRFLDVNVNYTLNDTYANSLGLGWVMKLGPLQWYFIQDNFSGLLDPSGAQRVGLRTGFNFVFGKVKSKSK